VSDDGRYGWHDALFLAIIGGVFALGGLVALVVIALR